jgi:hypothetical protein
MTQKVMKSTTKDCWEEASDPGRMSNASNGREIDIALDQIG